MEAKQINLGEWESFGRILADHPERLEELAGIMAEYARALHAIPCDTTVFGSTALSIKEMIAGNNIITAQGKVYWIDLGDFGYGDPLLDFRIMDHMSLPAPNPFLRRILHMDRSMLRRFYEAFKKQYFGQNWNSPELREKMVRIGHIQAAKVMYTWPSANHLNLPFLQGKKIKTALNLFIGDHMKLE